MTEKKKRVRREPEASKALILDATEKLMRDEGYAVITSRRVARETGLAPALIHYYFPTTDDLFVALHRRMLEGHADEFEKLAGSANPVRSLWEFFTDRERGALGVEFLALANHREPLRQVLTSHSEAARARQAAILATEMAKLPQVAAPISPEGLVTLMLGAARLLINEEGVGITTGHREVRALVDWVIDQVDRNRPGSEGTSLVGEETARKP